MTTKKVIIIIIGKIILLKLYFREFSVRRVRDYFRTKRSLTDTNEIQKEYKYGIDSLNLIHRQVC